MAWSQSQQHVTFGETEVRYPAVAGQFYPKQPQRLRAQVDELLQAAQLGPQQGIVHAVIAPHAGYIYSGPIAGYSFRSLPPPDGRTIYLLGPAHYVPLSGVAVGEFRAMATPLGQTPVAVELGHRLVTASRFIHLDEGAHTPEHCLEVELPFLQVLAGRAVPGGALAVRAGRSGTDGGGARGRYCRGRVGSGRCQLRSQPLSLL